MNQLTNRDLMSVQGGGFWDYILGLSLIDAVVSAYRLHRENAELQEQVSMCAATCGKDAMLIRND